MKNIRITLVAATATLLLIFTGCKDNDSVPITYPAIGTYGDNILSEQVTSVAIDTKYSMKAVLPKGASLKIILKDGYWYYLLSNPDWSITEYSNDYKSQEFTVIGDKKTADLHVKFEGEELIAGSYITVEYYENGAKTPTKIKKLQIQ